MPAQSHLNQKLLFLRDIKMEVNIRACKRQKTVCTWKNNKTKNPGEASEEVKLKWAFNNLLTVVITYYSYNNFL